MQAFARPLALSVNPFGACRLWLAALMWLFALAGLSPRAVAEEQTVGLSGKPLPRFETLRFNTVNGFSGPSKDHPLRWQYTRKGLPVVVIAETETWRRIVDPDGEKVWVHRAQLLSEAGTAVVRGQDDVALHARAGGKGRVRAVVEPGVIVTVRGCEGGWCAVKIDKRKGFLPQSALWGLGTPPSEPEPVPVGLVVSQQESPGTPAG